MSENSLKPPKTLSIVTVVYNRENEIKTALEAVSSQTIASRIEHVIVDGKSTDATLDIIKKTKSNATKMVISEPDDGIYDALNKGFMRASGDYIGILHSDDTLKDAHVLEEIMHRFEEVNADVIYSNVELYDESGVYKGIVRPHLRDKRKLLPDQVGHMGIFMTKEVAQSQVPPFDTNYKISADLKHQLLILDDPKNRVYYYDRTVALFKIGGYSTGSLKGYFTGLLEARRAWNEVRGWGGTLFILSKIVLRNRRR